MLYKIQIKDLILWKQRICILKYSVWRLSIPFLVEFRMVKDKIANYDIRSTWTSGCLKGKYLIHFTRLTRKNSLASRKYQMYFVFRLTCLVSLYLNVDKLNIIYKYTNILWIYFVNRTFFFYTKSRNKMTSVSENLKLRQSIGMCR